MKKALAFLLTVLTAFFPFPSSPGASAENSSLSVLTNIDVRKHVVKYVFTDEEDNVCTGPDGYAIIECQYEGNRNFPFFFIFRLDFPEKKITFRDNHTPSLAQQNFL